MTKIYDDVFDSFVPHLGIFRVASALLLVGLFGFLSSHELGKETLELPVRDVYRHVTQGAIQLSLGSLLLIVFWVFLLSPVFVATSFGLFVSLLHERIARRSVVKADEKWRENATDLPKAVLQDLQTRWRKGAVMINARRQWSEFFVVLVALWYPLKGVLDPLSIGAIFLCYLFFIFYFSRRVFAIYLSHMFALRVVNDVLSE